MDKLLALLGLQRINRKGEQTMEQQQPKRASKVTYVYGQLYRGYLESNKAEQFKIKSVYVREWKKILGWLKKNQYIVNFELGNTIDTACELNIEGFNGDKLIYKNYLKAIERNMEAEKVA